MFSMYFRLLFAYNAQVLARQFLLPANEFQEIEPC